MLQYVQINRYSPDAQTAAALSLSDPVMACDVCVSARLQSSVSRQCPASAIMPLTMIVIKSTSFREMVILALQSLMAALLSPLPMLESFGCWLILQCSSQPRCASLHGSVVCAEASWLLRKFTQHDLTLLTLSMSSDCAIIWQRLNMHLTFLDMCKLAFS